MPIEDFGISMPKLNWPMFLSRFCTTSGIALAERIMVNKSNGIELFEGDIVAFHTRTSMMSILEITAAKSFSSRFEHVLKSNVRKHETVETEVLLTNLAQQTVQIVPFLSFPLSLSFPLRVLNSCPPLHHLLR